MYKCSKCGFVTPIKMGFCKECNSYGTLELEIIEQSASNQNGKNKSQYVPKKFDYSSKQEGGKLERFKFESSSLNNLFGGGLAKGSISYLAAEPGAGKSTFLGQLPGLLQNKQLKIVYYSGEENQFQVADRLKRLHENNQSIIEHIDLYYGENLEELLAIVERDQPDIVIMDSLQKIGSSEKEGDVGSISQQNYCIDKFTFTLKKKGITGVVIGHINKTGELAGAKKVEHIVDMVLKIEGSESRTDSVRLIKCLKSRFGGIDNVGVMKMTSHGFDILDPENAFKAFIEESGQGSGSVFCPTLEGNQLFLLEVQSLLTETKFSNPKRVSLGVSFQKLDILIAVIMKLTRLPFEDRDIFSNIIGPINKNTTGVDLAVVASLISGYLGRDVKQYIFIGEVGLLGEIRTVSKQEEIVNKLKNMGYKEEYIISREKHKTVLELLDGIFGLKFK